MIQRYCAKCSGGIQKGASVNRANERPLMLRSSAVVATALAPRLALLRAMLDAPSLGAAAESVGVPSPTAVRWLAALNEAAGIALSVRTGRHVELTAAGVELARAAADANTALAVGVARAVEAGDPRHGHIVFAFPRSLGAIHAPRLLRSYRAAHPGIGFTLVQGSHELLVEKLHNATVDIALSVLRDADTAVDRVELFREPFVLVVPEDHRLAGRQAVRLTDCRAETMVGLAMGTALRGQVNEMLTEAGIDAGYGFEADELDTARGLVAAGVGVAVLPASAGEAAAGSVEIPILPRRYRRIGLVTSTLHPLSPAAERFLNWVRSTMRAS
ncbi:LysR family transcriptional regulator [Dactylosporangium sp. CA-092794]|uniref:LysR family transcriptional regulator n=1 Tax=Dactylosporangium sp. CA-092794 TaxID=3239929 RepID=UPI003D8B19E4